MSGEQVDFSKVPMLMADPDAPPAPRGIEQVTAPPRVEVPEVFGVADVEAHATIPLAAMPAGVTVTSALADLAEAAVQLDSAAFDRERLEAKAEALFEDFKRRNTSDGILLPSPAALEEKRERIRTQLAEERAAAIAGLEARRAIAATAIAAAYQHVQDVQPHARRVSPQAGEHVKLQAKTLDALERAEAREWARESLTAIAERYAATADEENAAFVRWVEARRWPAARTPEEGEVAVRLAAAVKARRAGRVPADVQKAVADFRYWTSGVRQAKLDLAKDLR